MMKALQDHVVDMKFGTHSIASPTPIMFGLAQCHKDLSKKECHSCFNIAKEMLNECILSTGGTIFLDGCFIRFDNYNFFDESICKDDNDTKNCGKPSKITQDKYMRTDFATQVGDATSIVTLMAVVNKGFGVSETKSRLLSVYILGQCWNTLDQKKCAECLNDTRTKISRCVPGAEGRATNADCYLRYSTHKFFNDGAFAVGQDDHGDSLVLLSSYFNFSMKTSLLFIMWNRILLMVWKDYKSNSITQSIDSRLNGNFDKEQASHVLQIGLLCTQTRRSLRPSMSEVLQMLTNAATSIRLPAQPPFQNSSLLATKSTTKSSTLNSSLSSSWHSNFGTSNIGSSQFGSPYSSGSHSSDILMPERSKYSRPT
ncbi:hypothetical protein ACH5RR_025519 [Cinchona calisaya]|uniref:Gnk2-homologous domain-containing protein n=1 Tax=Cinchona calisaya TaxID=153742 RepID=A0ABD2YZV6_9GENT